VSRWCSVGTRVVQNHTWDGAQHSSEEDYILNDPLFEDWKTLKLGNKYLWGTYAPVIPVVLSNISRTRQRFIQYTVKRKSESSSRTDARCVRAVCVHVRVCVFVRKEGNENGLGSEKENCFEIEKRLNCKYKYIAHEHDFHSHSILSTFHLDITFRFILFTGCRCCWCCNRKIEKSLKYFMLFSLHSLLYLASAYKKRRKILPLL
jgi:hypothetical protein